MPINPSDAAELRSILTSGDRGGFYYAYAQMVKSENSNTFDQVMIQAQITTYGGEWGGAAILGNAYAQAYAGNDANGDPKYNLTLDDFSYDIAGRLFEGVSRNQRGQSELILYQSLQY